MHRWFTLFTILTLSPLAPAQEKNAWTHWRGPSGQGYVEDSKVPLKWSEKENVLWKIKLPGRGNSTPIISGDRVFLTAASKDGLERFVLCLDAGSGKVLWQKTASKDVPAGRTHAWNGFASASCTTDGERVYAFFGTPGLFCFDMDGKQLWHHDFGVFTSSPGWGQAASPFLFEDLIIQNCDNDGPKGLPKDSKDKTAPMALVALDKVKGTVRWETPRNQGQGFSTPRLIDAAGKKELVLNGPMGVWSYDPKSGQEIWHCERRAGKDQSKFGEPIPVSDGSMLFAPSGRPGPFQGIRLGGKGDVSKSHVAWEITRKGRDVSSQILVAGLIYACDNKGVLSCYEAKSGKTLYTERLSADGKSLGSPLLIQGKLVYVLDTGESFVIEPGPEYRLVSRNVIGDNLPLDFGASPAVANGRLYLRSQSYLYCIGQ